MSDRPALKIKTASKTFANGTVALQDLNLTVQAGEFVSLVGSSGCGKSTVLRAIASLIKFSSGSIEWGEADLQKELAFVFQEPALMPWANVFDNVRLPLKLAGVSKSKSRLAVQSALHLVELEGFHQAYPRQLSGGMKMRVSIARALVTEPRLMLMDEPFGALDEMTRSKLNSDLLELWQEKQWTVVFVTHNIYEAVYLSNRVVVMAARPGRIIADVPIEVSYPRQEGFRTSQVCNDYCREIGDYLEKGRSQPEKSSLIIP